MSPKKILNWIKDYNRPLAERSFVLMTITAFITLMVIFVWDIFIGESLLKLIVLGASNVTMLFMVFLSMKLNKTYIPSLIVSLGIIFVILPIEFFQGDGVYGCTPIWYAFAFMYIGVNVTGKLKYPLLVAVPVSAILCYILAYLRPDLLVKHDMLTAYLDSAASVVGVGFTLFFSVNFLKDLYSGEKDLAETQRTEIEELSRAQSRFFSSMSHEIRTPINTIIGLNEMTLREEDISEEIADNSRNIRSASKMLLTTINDILDISKIESGKMDIVNVEYNMGDMLSDIVGMTWLRAKEKGLEFHVEVDQNCPVKYYGDEVRIKQIIINILTNAIKYTQKGSVHLSIRCAHQENNIATLVFSVADTGMGIKKESLPYLFTAFKRVDEDKNRYIEGTGLGLSIVKQFVDMMGGTISVNSVYTKGSTFVVELPQEVVDQSAIGELNLEERHSISKKEHYKQSFEAPEAHVLVVDDNETNILVATKLLRDTKVQIDTATNGADALNLCLKQHYDTILMDHLMPEMDGVECLHAIREQVGGLNLTTPIVVLTANAGSENQALYRREGFDGYLLKPVTGTQLESELVEHLPRELVTITGQTGGAEESGLYIEKHTHKVSVIITTESLCDLPQRMIEQKNIQVIPHRIMTDHGWFTDGEEIESEGLLAYMEAGGMAQTESQSVEDIESFFAEQLTKAQNIIHISMARNVSDAYDRACEASKTFDNVSVVDSGHLSSGMGLMVLYAARRAAEDASVEDILNELKDVQHRIKTSFIVSSTEYLYKCGRIGKRVHDLTTALMLHPVIVLKKSAMTVGRVEIGTREFTYKHYIKTCLDTLEPIDDSILFITYVGMTEDELEMITQEVSKKSRFREIIYQKASPTITANCGAGTFGLLYMTKR